MSVECENLGTGYLRLPQSTSDIETSEDEISQHENLIYYRKLGTPRKKLEVKPKENSQVTMGDYQPLGNDHGSNASREVHINGFSNINYTYSHGNAGPSVEDEMIVLGAVGSSQKVEVERNNSSQQMLSGHQHPMSAMRRVAFVMSICLCIFTIVAFLWVLPCDWATCPMLQNERSSGSSWEKTLSHLELIGRINIVPSGNKHHNNILFLVRGEMRAFLPQLPQQANISFKHGDPKGWSSQIPAGGGGIITLMGSTGDVVWLKSLPKVPRDIDCGLADLDGDGQKDCILVGADDHLSAFDPVTSKDLWVLNKAEENFKPIHIDFPLILPDLDGDSISELLLTCNFSPKLSRSSSSSINPPSIAQNKTDRNFLFVLSGKTGNIFGSPYAISNCTHISGLRINEDWVLTFTCKDTAGEDSVRSLAVDILYELVKNHSMPFALHRSKDTGGSQTMNQHKTAFVYYLTPKLASEQSEETQRLFQGKKSTYHVSGRTLKIFNNGHCPQDCWALAHVSDDRDGRNSTLWNDGGEKMYVLHPTVLSFSDNARVHNTGALQGPVYGFVLKFWHWTSISLSDQPSINVRLKRMNRPRTDEPDSFLQSVKENVSGSADTPLPQTAEGVSKRSGTASSPRGFKNNIYFHKVKERIVILTFNETNTHLVNASESEILQLCEATECQPSLAFQEQSLMIADLDEDGSKELVSYLTTYGDNGELKSTEGLHLMSKVRVVRLEAELPKLYKAVTHTYDNSLESSIQQNGASDQVFSGK